MARHLIEDSPPIEAGPIVIDDWRIDKDTYPGIYIEYSDFVCEALSHGIAQGKASKALRLAVAGLIKHHDLPILPPYEELEGEESWGPHGTDDYYIELFGYYQAADEIESFARRNTDDVDTLRVLKFVREAVEEDVWHDKDKIAFDQLPDAFFTPQHPQLHLKSGRLLTINDFRDAVCGLRTSSGKATAVFDSLIRVLGDEEAIKKIEKLEVLGNSTDRRILRENLYIKLQAVADYVDKNRDLPQSEHGFNALSFRLLDFILQDEDTDALFTEDLGDN